MIKRYYILVDINKTDISVEWNFAEFVKRCLRLKINLSKKKFIERKWVSHKMLSIVLS